MSLQHPAVGFLPQSSREHAHFDSTVDRHYCQLLFIYHSCYTCLYRIYTDSIQCDVFFLSFSMFLVIDVMLRTSTTSSVPLLYPTLYLCFSASAFRTVPRRHGFGTPNEPLVVWQRISTSSFTAYTDTLFFLVNLQPKRLKHYTAEHYVHI